MLRSRVLSLKGVSCGPQACSARRQGRLRSGVGDPDRLRRDGERADDRDADDHRSARRTSPRQFVLGQLYKQALEAKGFKVAYKENIGSSELIDTALTSGKINFYPEYTGVLALNIAHLKTPLKTAAATYVAAKTFEERRGYTMLRQTPFFDADSFRC